jgi:hypothetical protein
LPAAKLKFISEPLRHGVNNLERYVLCALGDSCPAKRGLIFIVEKVYVTQLLFPIAGGLKKKCRIDSKY